MQFLEDVAVRVLAREVIDPGLITEESAPYLQFPWVPHSEGVGRCVECNFTFYLDRTLSELGLFVEHVPSCNHHRRN